MNFIKHFNLTASKRTAFFYTFSSLSKSFVNILAGFIVLRWITPEDMGIWQGVMIFNTYAQILNLGIPTGLNRELPFLQGAGKHKEAEELAASAQLFSIISSILSFFLLLLVAFVFYITNFDTKTIWAVIGMGTIIAISFYNSYLVVLFRSNTAFNKLSLVYMLETAFLVILIPVIFFYHFYGLIIYYVLGAIFLAFLTHIYKPIKVKNNINLRNLFRLIKVGLPIYGLGYLQGVSKSFPKLILLSVGGTVLLGLYSPVFAIVNAMLLIPKSLTQFIYPKLNYELGKTNNPARLWPMINRTSIYLFIGFTIIFIPLWFILPEGIRILFPKYTESIFACQIALISGVVNASFVGIHALNSVKAFKERLFITLVYLFASFLFPYLGTIYFEPLVGVTLGMVCANIILQVISFYITKKVLFRGQ